MCIGRKREASTFFFGGLDFARSTHTVTPDQVPFYGFAQLSADAIAYESPAAGGGRNEKTTLTSVSYDPKATAQSLLGPQSANVALQPMATNGRNMQKIASWTPHVGLSPRRR